MPILVSAGFQITDRGQIAGRESGEGIAEIVLMVGLVGLTDFCHRRWRQVVGIGGLFEVLKAFVVGM